MGFFDKKDKNDKSAEALVASVDSSISDLIPSNAVVPEFSEIEPLRFISVNSGESDDDCGLYYVSDVYLLLNAERILNVLGEDTYRHLINSLGSYKPSATASLRSQLSDDDMLDSHKSRYIQSASDMRAYTQDLIERFSDLKESVEAQIAEQQASSVEQPVSNSNLSNSDS